MTKTKDSPLPHIMPDPSPECRQPIPPYTEPEVFV